MKSYFVVVLSISSLCWGMERFDTSFITGGDTNTAVGSFATIGGGANNSAAFFSSELHSAVDMNDIESVKQLIKEGADLNIKDTEGDAPLHYALRSKYDTITLLLIASGAHIKQKNNYGEYPARSIIENYEFLVGSEKKPYQYLFKTILLAGVRVTDTCCMSTTKSFIPHSLFGSQRIQFKTYNPLYLLDKKDIERIIVEDNWLEFSNWLEHAANIDKQDEIGATPLMYAGAQGQICIVQRLLAKGADPLLEDNYGRTVFDIVNIILRNKDDLELTQEEQEIYRKIMRVCYRHSAKLLWLTHSSKAGSLNKLPLDLIKVTMLFLTGCVYSDMCKMT